MDTNASVVRTTLTSLLLLLFVVVLAVHLLTNVLILNSMIATNQLVVLTPSIHTLVNVLPTPKISLPTQLSQVAYVWSSKTNALLESMIAILMLSAMTTNNHSLVNVRLGLLIVLPTSLLVLEEFALSWSMNVPLVAIPAQLKPIAVTWKRDTPVNVRMDTLIVPPTC